MELHHVERPEIIADIDWHKVIFKGIKGLEDIPPGGRLI